MTLSRAANGTALEDYASSYNMRGIAVEVLVVVRPMALVRTVSTTLTSDAALPAALLRVRHPGRGSDPRPDGMLLPHIPELLRLSDMSYTGQQ